MISTRFSTKTRHLFIVIAVMLFFTNCKKDIQQEQPVNNTNNNPTVQPADLTTKVTSSVSGFITNESNQAISGAEVKVGIQTTLTDPYGYFEINNAEVVKNAAVVTVTRWGYFKAVKTYIAENGKAAFFRIGLIPKSISGTINSNSGGEVLLSNGFKVSLPADAVVNASSGTAYSGNINVSSYWFDPTNETQRKKMPGDLRGVDTGGVLKILKTYGMAVVELSSDAGELLQIATGKKATLTMAIPSAISSSAPATIPMWYFDEANGLWKQDGIGTKTGNTYVGEVSHFSFWDYSTPGNYVNFNCTIVDANGFPLIGTLVEISEVANASNTRSGTTDVTGYVAGAVPENSQLLVNIIADNGCTVSSQTITTTTSNISLGTITLAAANTATITGSVTDCSGLPVTYGYIIMTKDQINTRYNISPGGSFSISTVVCGPTNEADFIAEDHIGSHASYPLGGVALTAGINDIGIINACATPIGEYIVYDINSGLRHEEFYATADSISMTGSGAPLNTILIKGNRNVYDKTVTLGLNNLTGVSQIVNYVLTTEGTYTMVSANFPAVPLTITEYGPVGGFISGNFDGTIDMGLNGLGHMIGSFRVKRTF